MLDSLGSSLTGEAHPVLLASNLLLVVNSLDDALVNGLSLLQRLGLAQIANHNARYFIEPQGLF